MKRPKKNDLDPRNAPPGQVPPVLDRQVYRRGETIIEQDSRGNRAFYIESGRVEVSMQEGVHRITIAELGPGEIFGEMALIEHEERSAGVIALADTVVAVISARDLEQKIEGVEDRAMRALIHVLIKRLKHSNRGQMNQYKNFADFQDRIAGLVEKAAGGVDQSRRQKFREDVLPLLEQLDRLLDSYGNPK